MQIIQKHIDIKGKNIWTRMLVHPDSNDRDTIVFLHDALGSIEQWKSFPDDLALATGMNVLLYDRQGHGRSDSKGGILNHRYYDEEALIFLPLLLKEFSISEPILYGHSDGGTIALIYASTIRAKALILEAAHIFVEEITRNGVLESIKDRDAIVNGLKKYHKTKAKILFDNWAKLWSGTLMQDWNIEHLLKKIDIPTLIIQGKLDNYGSKNQVIKIAEGLNGFGEIRMIDNVGHFPHKEVPTQILNTVNKFLNQIEN